MGRISDAFPSNARRPRRSLLKPPARARSARARLQAGAGSHVFAAFPGIEPESSEKDARETHGCASWCFALLLLAVACARLLVFSVACDACGSRFSRASRSSIARFHFLGLFSNPLNFSKNATPSTRKPCFLRSGGSQNEAKMLQFRRCVRTPRCFEKCNTLAQWPAWGRSPTGDPATEPCKGSRGGRERSDLKVHLVVTYVNPTFTAGKLP